MGFKNIKIGICEWALPAPMRGPFCCKVAKDFGISGIEIELGKYEEHFPLGDKYILDAYDESRKKYNVEFTGVAINVTDDFSMISGSDSEKEIIEYAILRGIDCADKLGVPLVHIPAFGVSEMNTEDDINITARALKKACNYAKNKGIKVCSENNLDSEKSLELIRGVDCDNFGIYFDTENYSLKGLNTAKIAANLFEYIPEFHVKDGFDDYSTHLLGQGGAKVFDTLKVFSNLNYEGYILLENYYSRPKLCKQNDDPFELLHRDMSILMEMLKKL